MEESEINAPGDDSIFTTRSRKDQPERQSAVLTHACGGPCQTVTPHRWAGSGVENDGDRQFQRATCIRCGTTTTIYFKLGEFQEIHDSPNS